MRRLQKVLLASALLLAHACRGSNGAEKLEAGAEDAALPAQPGHAGRDAAHEGEDRHDAATPRDAAQERDAASDAGASAGAVKQATVFFFGHSLVDQDMPMMLGSLAAARSKTYSAKGQLGWGTALDAHWNWDGAWEGAPLGFADENRGRPFFAGEGKAQLTRGTYDVMVMTESNGHTRGDGASTVDYATRLARHARSGNPNIRVFLYSSWLDRSEFPNLQAWQQRTEADAAWWESVADRVNAALEGPDVQLIPGAAILSKVTRAVEEGKIPGMAVNDLFREGDGVHVNDLGFYVIALAHYAVIFRDSPLGLPVDTQTEDGPADTPSAEAAARIQRIVWDSLQAYPRAGIAP